MVVKLKNIDRDFQPRTDAYPPRISVNLYVQNSNPF